MQRVSQAFVDTDSERLSFEPPMYSEEPLPATDSLSSAGIPVSVETQTTGRGLLTICSTEGLAIGPPPICFHEDIEEQELRSLQLEALPEVEIRGRGSDHWGSPFQRDSLPLYQPHCEVERLEETDTKVLPADKSVELVTFRVANVPPVATYEPNLTVQACQTVAIPMPQKRAKLHITTSAVASIDANSPHKTSLLRLCYDLVRTTQLYEALIIDYNFPVNERESMYLSICSSHLPPILVDFTQWKQYLLSSGVASRAVQSSFD